MRNYESLDVWRLAHDLALDIYRDTLQFPRIERFGLATQLRRSIVSVPSNIAEGSGRSTRPDYARFIDIAIGSCNESEYHIRLAHDLGYFSDLVYRNRRERIDEVRRKAHRLRRAVLADMTRER